MKTKLTILSTIFLSGCCLCGKAPRIANPLSPTEPFRIAIIPDTQWASLKWPGVLKTTTRWIAANHESMDIKYVLHVGDMVENGHADGEWKNFNAAMSVLDGKVPYILAVGNHDIGKTADAGGTTKFNEYFPRKRFTQLAGFGGTYPRRKNDNSYHTFDAGGIVWLVIALKFCPTDEELKWANDIVALHPGHQVIVLTHSYLTHRGRDTSGENIWNRFVKSHENILMVLCGHLSTVHYVSTGDKGNKVYEMLFDWQNDRQPEPNSYFVLAEIDPVSKRISIRTYSPLLDNYKTDPRAKFEFRDVKFVSDRNAALTAN
ncbi:MAG: metallophosphoesterase [Phycisphaerae bacterium]|jgi:3',5'-cyclic AMP phosphodiesterase CpdA|nr:metallophosphoesterase [Phycisphaerae bacterium]